jgi:uncharacterized membrane protein YidH (DUF202 family)
MRLPGLHKRHDQRFFPFFVFFVSFVFQSFRSCPTRLRPAQRSTTVTAELCISALLTIAMSGAVVWLGMRYIARRPFSFPDVALAAVIPVVVLVPLELAVGFLVPTRILAVYLVTTLIAIALQAWILRLLCRRADRILTRFKAGLIATLAMVGSIFMGSPIYPLVLDHFFKPA